MYKPDIISQICLHCDYPLWRTMIEKHRSKFGKIILYPSRHHGAVDLEKFWKEVFPETWVAPVAIDYGVEDWRQAETIPCLNQSDSDWIMFTEADFFVRDWDMFFEDMRTKSEVSDLMGLWNPTNLPYIHPSCLFIKRELLEKTSKDFRAHPEINGSDHFAMITQEAMQLGKMITLQDLGYDCRVSPEADAFHLGSLTYTYQDWHDPAAPSVSSLSNRIGAISPEAFMVYNYWMRKANVKQSPEFMKLSQDIEDFFKPRFPDLDLENSPWAKYFKI